MIGWYCPNKFQCNILLSQFELSPLHVDLILILLSQFELSPLHRW
jgi:hypothetical protein